MDFLNKLEYLMKIKNLNNHTLSNACGIPYTTIDGWYKKGYEGLKLTTLRKLSLFFETDLNYWVEIEKSPATTKAEAEDSRLNDIIECWGELNEDGKESLYDQAVYHQNSAKYKKCNDVSKMA